MNAQLRREKLLAELATQIADDEVAISNCPRHFAFTSILFDSFKVDNIGLRLILRELWGLETFWHSCHACALSSPSRVRPQTSFLGHPFIHIHQL